MADKAPGAFLTIGELSAELGIPQHILRYWETRFSKLRPLTRAGNRRYYRPEDVALVRQIHQLLNVEGYTVKGVQKLLSAKAKTQDDGRAPEPKPIPASTIEPAPVQLPASTPPPATAPTLAAPTAPPPPPSYIPDLVLIRDRLKAALAAAR